MTGVVVPDRPVGAFPTAWRACVGTGRLALALRADHQASLARVQREIGFGHLRGHGLLSDDMGVLRSDDAGHRRYGFGYVDQVHDRFAELGVRPFVELGFMPTQLASGDRTVFWWGANVTPPRDLREWTDLVTALVRHLVDRYGLAEVRHWPFEVWNEPDLGIFWAGDQDAYLQLYAATARAVKEVDAGLQVGGPALSPGGADWWAPFAAFVERHDVPVDFVSAHAYTSHDPQEVPFGCYQRLRPAADLLAQLAAPRQALAGTALAGLPVHVTEFNSSYRPDNPIHDTAYQAAYLAPVLAGGGDLVDSFAHWTFCDVFEELGPPTSFLHGGFGLLTHRGLAKPAYHLYTFLARTARSLLARGEDHLVCADDDGRVTVLAWQPVGGSDGPPAPDRHELTLSLPVAAPDGTPVNVLRERVGEHDGNVFAAWRELGRPASPTTRQLDVLRRCEAPAVEHSRSTVSGGRVRLSLSLSRHEVTFVELTPAVETRYDGLDDRRLLGGDDDRLVAAFERRTVDA